ncbi:hypothetical protein FF38_09113 [Lucilia cuprina]|uniref:Uncharacterized protein n=1 Tax=Lucilia cuprina TaxID=7375 RepID=A0A0L0BWG2_LUCCU|nr:hypothetical protein FF38_09113 [Lucilia cuprina]
MSFSNDNKKRLDKKYSQSFSNESKSLNSTPTKSSFKLTGQRLAHKHLPSFFGTNLCTASSSTNDTCKINTSPVRAKSVVEKKSSSFDATRTNIFCRRYKSSYCKTTATTSTVAVTTSNVSSSDMCKNCTATASPSRRRQQEYYNFPKHKNALAFNELEIRSVEAKSVSTSSSSTSATLNTVAAGATKRTVATEGATVCAAHGVVRTKQAVDLLQQKRQQFSAKPKVFFKFALPDEFIPSRRGESRFVVWLVLNEKETLTTV